MTRYNIGELVRQSSPARRRKRISLRPLSAPLKFSLEYRQILRAYVRELLAEVERTVLPQYQAEMEAQKLLTTDKESWFERFRIFEEALRRNVMESVRSLFRSQAERHRQAFLTNSKSVLGIDLSTVVQEGDLEDLLETYAAANASLITNVGADFKKSVEQLIYRHQLEGVAYKTTAKMLRENLHTTQVRADLIATDQVQKLNADLNRTRQEQAGITSYLWRTSKDERVRSRHRELDGEIFKWGEPTGAEEGLPPGKPIRCRCIAVAQIEVPQ